MVFGKVVIHSAVRGDAIVCWAEVVIEQCGQVDGRGLPNPVPLARGRRLAPTASGQTLDERRLLSAAVIQPERSTRLLERVTREVAEDGGERRLLRPGDGLDELVFHPPVVNLKTVGVYDGEEFVTGDMGEKPSASTACRPPEYVLLAAAVQACTRLSVPKASSASARRGPDVVTIGEAAEILGVCEMTLRRWDRSGKFSPHRHPVNGYRVYRRADVLILRKRIETGTAA